MSTRRIWLIVGALVVAVTGLGIGLYERDYCGSALLPKCGHRDSGALLLMAVFLGASGVLLWLSSMVDRKRD